MPSLVTRFESFYARKRGRGKKTIYFHSSSIERKKKNVKNREFRRGTYTLRKIWVNINVALRAYLVQKYYSILRRQRLPPSNRFKKLLVEVVGQITPAEPYKSTALTIFETFSFWGWLYLCFTEYLRNTCHEALLFTFRKRVIYPKIYRFKKWVYIYIYAVL